MTSPDTNPIATIQEELQRQRNWLADEVADLRATLQAIRLALLGPEDDDPDTGHDGEE